jgi:CBS domain-containing protein
MLLRYFATHPDRQGDAPNAKVGEVMRRNPITISPEDTILKAIEIMRSNQIGCLPVLNSGKLVGMITEAEFLNITSNLIRRFARRRSE